MTYDLTLEEISAVKINDNFTALQDVINSKAECNGDSLKTFDVANATQITHAINKGLFDNTITTINSNITEVGDIVENIQAEGFKMPIHTNGQTKSWNTLYTAECDGLLFAFGFGGWAGNTEICKLEISGIQYPFAAGNAGAYVGSAITLPIMQGDTYKGVDGFSSQVLKFIPLRSI